MEPPLSAEGDPQEAEPAAAPPFVHLVDVEQPLRWDDLPEPGEDW